MVVTIDGPAGSGKSTVAGLFAKKAGFGYINSGAFYRAAAYFLVCHLKDKISASVDHSGILRIVEEEYNRTHGFTKNTENSVVVKYLSHFCDRILPSMYWKDDKIMCSNNTMLQHEIFSDNVSYLASSISSYLPLREKINLHIRACITNGNWIIEGRDAGTQIFPESSCKFYLDANPEVRAKRRMLQYQQNQNKYAHASYEQILSSIIERDERDANKGEHGLRIASGVKVINTGVYSIAQIFEKLYTIVDSVNNVDGTMNNISVNASNNDGAFSEDFDKMIDASFGQLFNADKIQEGDLIEGTVVKITHDDVFLDIGLKTEGRVSLSEFSDAKVSPKEADTIQVIAIKRNSNEEMVLSYTRALDHKSLGALHHAYKHGLAIKGKITEFVSSGFVVEIINSVQGFVPISQMDVVHINEHNAQDYVGNSYEFLVQVLFKNRKLQPILSRRSILMKLQSSSRQEFFDTHKEGDIVEGTVKNCMAFGAFVDLGNFDGLLHISDMSWSRKVRPAEVVKKGDILKFKVIKLDAENQKINLSLKALQENPWDMVYEKYPEGTIVSGEVIKILVYGIFVALEESIEGFVHISEMSWLKRINHPSEVVKVNSIVQCKILKVEREHCRISLGIKQVHNNPWDTVDTLYPVGYRLTIPIIKVLPHGVIVEFEEGYKGIIVREDYAWNKRNEPSLHVNDMIECVVLDHDKINREIKLGIKQITQNPWENETLQKGLVVECVVTSITDFGIFVAMSDGVEGLIPKSQCYDPHEYASYEDVRSKFKRGDKIQAVIHMIQPSNQRLVLSVRDLKEQSTRKEMEKHLISNIDNERVFSLGDAIQNNVNKN